MFPRRTALTVAILLTAGCAVEPIIIAPPPSAQTQRMYAEYFAPPVAVEAVTMADQTVWHAVGEDTTVQSAPETAPQVSDADRLLNAANLAQAAGDSVSYLGFLSGAADAGSAQAHYELAKIYTDGKLAPRDLNQAAAHLQASAALGNAEAVRVMGWQLIRGDNAAADTVAGAAMIEQAAASSVRAQREAGMLFSNLYDSHHLNDSAKGQAYLARAFDGGDEEAAYQLGRLKHRDGDDLNAIPALSFAAEHGNLKARQLLTQIDGGSGSDGVTQPVSTVAARVDQPDGEQLYQRANAIMLRHQRTLEQEGHAYALYSVAHDEGHQLAKLEMRALSGVKTLLDKREPGWLEREKSSVRAEQNR